MSKTVLTIDEYLKTRASTKNKIIAVEIAMLTAEGKDQKEYDRLQKIHRLLLQYYNLKQKLKNENS